MEFRESKFCKLLVEAVGQRVDQVVKHHKENMVQEDKPSTITVKLTLTPNAEASAYPFDIATSIALAPHPKIGGIVYASVTNDGSVVLGEFEKQASLPEMAR